MTDFVERMFVQWNLEGRRSDTLVESLNVNMDARRYEIRQHGAELPHEMEKQRSDPVNPALKTFESRCFVHAFSIPLNQVSCVPRCMCVV